ncbi:MAG TPA: ARMT1-like domain-containing protein [Tenuifilaceae bacterium]|nr:ARMT1-like domain-containing protein [Tenuifilaceae bacterium]
MADARCVDCFLKTYHRLFQKYGVAEMQQQKFLEYFHRVIVNQNFENSPIIQRDLNIVFCDIIEIADPFAEEKEESNRVALGLYKVWKERVIDADNPFGMALRLAIAGNIMDYGASNSFDINGTVERVLNADFAIDHSAQLKERIAKAQRILYLGDNAGEIVFDRLFIETFMHNDVTYAVKGGPILNDVTMKDALDVGMDNVADLISNGFDAPTTHLEMCSREFQEVFNATDLIISKGQGNLEGLIGRNDPRIFFLLMVKCDVIAEFLKVDKGSFIVYNQIEQKRKH